MRILHISPYAHSFYGGPNTAIRMISKLGVEAGLDIHVATTNAAGHKSLDFMDGDIQVDGGSTFHYFERSILPGWFFSNSMRKWLALNIKNFDVVHLHVPFTAPFMMGAKICQSFEIPYVVSLHGLIDPWCLKQKAWKKIPYLKLLEKKNFECAKFLHVTSSMEYDFVNSLNFGPEIYLMPLAVLFDHSDITIQPRIIDCKKIKLLFLGRLHPVKALPTVFKAIRQLVNNGMDLELNIAGAGDCIYESDLKKIAANEGIEKYINWHGHIDEARRRALFLEANLFILPSYHENFGLAAAEAMATGLPVILSEQVGLAQDVREFNAGLIVPCDDPSAIAISVQALMKPDKWLTSSKGAQKLVMQRYGSRRCAESLLSLYQKACA